MNVLIIDDQRNVIEGIRNGVDWEALQINQVYEATNISYAMTVIQNYTIDIMVCDIEMPMGNGIELLRRVREKGWNIECIFLTAHAKFEYANEAIKLSAFDYVLQPVKYKELEAVIHNAIEKIESDRQIRKLTDAGEMYRRNNRIYINSMLKGILDGNRELTAYYLEDEVAKEERITAETVYLPVYLSVLRIENYEIAAAKTNLLVQLKEVIHHHFGEMADRVFVVPASANHYVLLFYPDRTESMEAQARWQAERFIEGCQKMGIVTAAYMGSLCRIGELQEEYAQLKAFDENNVGGYSHLFCKEGQMGESRDEELNWNRYAILLKGHHYDIVSSELELYLNRKLEEQEITSTMLFNFVQAFVMFAYGVKDENGIRSKLLIHDPSGYEMYSAAGRSVENAAKFIRYVLECLKQGDASSEKKDSVIDRIKNYISLNIEKDISRNDIAQYIFMNPEYLSRYFKKEMGMGLSDYIVEEKVKRARSYLTNTRLPVSVIASKLGYSNFSYFAKVFKKSTGVSPNDYRRGETADIG